MKLNALKQPLLGALEMGLFMEQSLDRFTASRGAIIASFFVPAVVLIFMTIGIYSFSHVSQWPEFISLYIYGFTIAAIKYPVFLWLVWIYVKKKGYAQNFKKFVVVNNWLYIPFLFASMPAIIISVLHGHNEHISLSWFMCANGYAYFVLIFITARIFGIKSGDAGFTTLASMIVNGTVMLLIGKTGGMLVL